MVPVKPDLADFKLYTDYPYCPSKHDRNLSGTLNFACGHPSFRCPRLADAVEAAAIMPVIPLWGVVERPDRSLCCECGCDACEHPGKHPRQKSWINRGVHNPDIIRGWYAKWPNMNFGGTTGDHVVVVDIDSIGAKIWLDELEFAYCIRIPYTVSCQSGREGFGAHLYFKSTFARVRSGKGGHPEIDLKGYLGYVVLPGSRHISGRYYKWCEECRPGEIGELPE